MRTFLAALALLGCAGCLDFDQFGGSDAVIPDLGGADSSRPPVDLGARDSSLPRDGGGLGDARCSPVGFVGCNGKSATYCADTGNLIMVDCGGVCVGPDSCGLCTPGTTCANGNLSTCTIYGGLGATVPCPTLGGPATCLDAMHCAACVGPQVCGDGQKGTMVGSLYQCANGMIGNGAQCTFGCDVTTNACADLVPANQARKHSPSLFSCSKGGGGSSKLMANNGDTVLINTDAPSVMVNGQDLTLPFGAPYSNSAGNGSIVVIHVTTIDLGVGATVQLTGGGSLVILSDGPVDLGSGGGNQQTLISLTGARSNAAYAPKQVGDGGNGILYNGGGGAGHGTAGANGGVGNLGLMVMGGLAGAAYGLPFMLEPGARGGTGAPPSAGGNSAAGGYGGGGLQISSCGAITVGSTVVVNASGSGGSGGLADPMMKIGGGGGAGGSGGTLVLEGATVSNAGMLAANGGGGGSGGSVTGTGSSGATWSSQLGLGTPAGGGASGLGNRGGSGGARGTAPTPGGPGPDALGGGGGGGAVGKISIATSPVQPAPMFDQNLFSPAPTVGTTCVTVGGIDPVNCP